MSNVQIPNLPASTSLNGTEQFEGVQSGTSVRITAQQIATYTAAAYPAPGISSVTASAPISASTVSGAVSLSLDLQGVTNAYLATMAAGTVKANVGVGSASPSDVTPSAILDTFGTTKGSLLVRDTSAWAALTSGTSGQVLTANGTTALPSWQTLSVPSSGIAPTGVTAGTYGGAALVPVFTVLASGQISSVTNTSIAINASAVSGLAASATTDTTIADNITSGQLAAARYSPTLSDAMDAAFGSTYGDLLYRGSSGWTVLAPGTAGQLLQTQGAGFAPTWFSAGSGSVVQVNTGTGLTGGPITSSGTISIANTGVAAATYGTSAIVPVIAVNAQGQITSATNTTIDAVTLTTGTISGTPTNANDIVNKVYVDSISAGINFHASVVYATTTALPAYTYANGTGGVGATITANANGALVIDGHTFVSPTDVGKRVLIKNETSTNEPYNGVYTVTAVGDGSNPFVLTRATDFDTAGSGINQIDAGDFFLVTNGTTNANTSWVQQTPLPITVGTTGLVFTQFAAPVLYSAGTGLNLAGTVFNISNTGVTATNYGSASTVPAITVNAQGQITSATDTSIAINANQITSGTITVAQGGTGATTLTGYVKGNGTSAFTAASTIPNTDITGLGTMSTQNASSVAITGGTIDGTAIGGTTAAAGTFNALTVNGDAVISTSSSNAALRITQTGAGNALVVEDSANPDSTPFVVDASGYVIQGYASNITSAAFQSNSGSPFSGIRWNAASTGPTATLGKSRSATIGTNSIVSSGDTVGTIGFAGDDGAAFIQAAAISAAVDGTPGTNDMPGRLVFSTTADGASSPTERMRIDSEGRIGIAASTATGTRFNIGGSSPTASGGNVISSNNSVTVQSDVTGSFVGYRSNISTTAAAFTLGTYSAFRALFTTVGAGSAITNLYGFEAQSSLTSATNNYGFYGNIASGTGRWNFYAAGTADNYFAGKVGVGTNAPAVSLSISATDAILIPVGTTAQQPTGAAGMLRFNTTNGSFEGYDGSAWGSIGGGAVDGIFWENDQTVTNNYTITAGKNAGSFGPITINSGVTVTVPSGSTWSIV